MESSIYACVYIHNICLVGLCEAVKKDKSGEKTRADFHPINIKCCKASIFTVGWETPPSRGEEGTTVARQSSNSDTFPFLHHKMSRIQ